MWSMRKKIIMGKHEVLQILMAIGIYLKKIFLFVFLTVGSFFAPINPLIIGVIILSMLDMHAGIRAAKARDEEINPKGYFKTVIKLKDSILLIVGAHLMTVIFFPELNMDFAHLAAAFIAYIEFKSYCKNMKTATGNPIWDKINNLIPEVTFLKIKKNGRSRRG